MLLNGKEMRQNIFIVVISILFIAISTGIYAQMDYYRQEVDSLRLVIHSFTPSNDTLAYNSDLYKYRQTPYEILSAIHFKESTRSIDYVEGADGEWGVMQIMPFNWEIHCADLVPGNIHHSIECADRFMYYNYRKGGWKHAIHRYNPHDKKYEADVIRMAEVFGYTF